MSPVQSVTYEPVHSGAWLKAGKGLLPPRALPGKVWGGTKSTGTVGIGGKRKNRRAMKKNRQAGMEQRKG
jgi:hypothetical protein